ncbi:MAG: GlsB/YeaQ/YmgE family stress response membrane protein [Anaerococcus sp.]|nr:GlsB/YeaQ/YmgE family stress response membrane protein [Peptoniphilaceae bacterium]MDY2918921.1 GlsB/YeaQ/YmgE family stress response membrane protein [Anaerococcus sp.]
MGNYGFFASIIIGALAGWIASKLMNRDAQMGAFANIIVGVLGGGLGNWLFRTLFNASTPGLFLQIIYAIIGACILLFIVNLVTGRSNK